SPQSVDPIGRVALQLRCRRNVAASRPDQGAPREGRRIVDQNGIFPDAAEPSPTRHQPREMAQPAAVRRSVSRQRRGVRMSVAANFGSVRRSFFARAAASAVWLFPAVVVIAAVLLRVRSLENADVSWLLTLAEKLLDGRRDFIEVNPPGAIFAYI